MDRKPFVVACIPAYKEEKSIGRVVLLTRRYVDMVVVCDDGSPDLTGDIAEALGAVVIRHGRNKGKGAALRSAIKRAWEMNPDIVVVLDADGQHNPDDIPRLLEPILNNKADMTVGSRYIEGSVVDAPLYRRLGLRFINFLSRRAIPTNVKDTQSGFRAFSAKALSNLLSFESDGYVVEMEQLALAEKSGLRIVEVPVHIQYEGLENTSKNHPLFHGTELVGFALRLIVEERPLLFLGVPGALLILLGVVFGGYFLWYFNLTRYFSLPMALVSFGALSLGTLLFITSLVLYAISRLKRR